MQNKNAICVKLRILQSLMEEYYKEIPNRNYLRCVADDFQAINHFISDISDPERKGSWNIAQFLHDSNLLYTKLITVKRKKANGN